MIEAAQATVFQRQNSSTSRKTFPTSSWRPGINAAGPERFINRELSWLQFNRRVLEEAEQSQPSAAGAGAVPVDLRQQSRRILHGARRRSQRPGARRHTTESPDGLTPGRAARADRRGGVAGSRATSRRAGANCAANSRRAGIVLVDVAELSKADRGGSTIISAHIFPVLTPLAIDPAHPFPFIPNLGFSLALQLVLAERRQADERADPRAPEGRALHPPAGAAGGAGALGHAGAGHRVIHPAAVSGLHVKGQGAFRVIRDSDIEIEEEAEDLVRSSKRVLKRRRRGSVIGWRSKRPCRRSCAHFVQRDVAVAAGEVFLVDGMLALDELVAARRARSAGSRIRALQSALPRAHPRNGGDCFAAIRQKDLIVHHPYESFDIVVQFLQQAARDPDVVAIKQTLYRTSADIPIVRALVEAAEAGKSVTALVELKARFDEEANIRWARDLERAGAQVVFGFIELKTHAKLSMVVRREGGSLMTYVHVGTGNYHPVRHGFTPTSRFSPPIPRSGATCRESSISSPAMPSRPNWSAWRSRRSISRADPRAHRREIGHAKAGRPAAIWMKINALVDPEIIDALYEAQRGRADRSRHARHLLPAARHTGAFRKHPRQVIVGRFLEHGRIYCFGAGHGLPIPRRTFISARPT